MPNPENRACDESAREAALFWFTRIHSGDATAQDHAAFERWLQAAPRHQREYAALSHVWTSLSEATDPRLAPAPQHRALTRRGVVLAGGLAGAAACVIGARESGLITDLTSTYHTGKGEQRRVTLADQSTVDLDADTALSVRFTPTARRLSLHRGRALFTVAADTARPFSVVAAEGSTTARGTQFVVDRLPARVAVSVIEHEVLVTDHAQTAMRLPAGQAVTYSAAGMGHPFPRSASEATAWQRGQLIFDNQPLGDVVAVLSRYRPGMITIIGNDLRDLKVSGVFDTRLPEQALASIQHTLPLRAREVTRYWVILTAA